MINNLKTNDVVTVIHHKIERIGKVLQFSHDGTGIYVDFRNGDNLKPLWKDKEKTLKDWGLFFEGKFTTIKSN